MKLLSKLLVLIVLLVGSFVYAEQILVLPTDLYVDNYYSFVPVSQIIADDVIDNFNKSGSRVSAISLYDVKKKIASDTTLKASVTYVLSKFKNDNYVDFANLKKISNAFNVKSVLLISSSVVQNSSVRDVWEVLEISSAFEAINNYPLKTCAVLTDNVNGVVMWSGKYDKVLGDSEARFWAKTSAQAVSQLEKLRNYSKNIVSKNISESVVLRFYPKTIKQNDSTTVEKTEKPLNDYAANPFGRYRQYPTKEIDTGIDVDPSFEF